MTSALGPADPTDVLVLGAGVSGLAAAAGLAQGGCTVRVLDARDRVGGRILTRRGGGWPVPMDLGAEFIQGRLPALFRLAHEAGLPVVELNGSRWLGQAGQQLAQYDEFVARIDEILARLPDLAPEDDQSFDQFLATLRPQATSKARDLARARVESYDAAAPDRVSVRFLRRERRAEHQIDGDRVFRLVTGYDGIPDALRARIPAAQGAVELETIATDVHWAPGAVSVDARGPDGAARGPFSARRLLVALPIGVLRAEPTAPGAVRFSPPLTERTLALRGLEMGNVVKLVLAFKERFWEPAFSDRLGFLVADEEPFGTWWTGYPLYAPVLVAWTGGPPADALADLSSAARVDRALDCLARVAHVSRGVVDAQLVVWDTHDWAADPFARGAYSYVRVGGIEAQAALARPIENTLFFAGEATELTGLQATVHGALFAGQRAAAELLGSLNKTPSPAGTR